MERRTGMYVSTLRNMVRATGGQFEISAHFPEGTVRIGQFKNLDPRDQDSRQERKETTAAG